MENPGKDNFFKKQSTEDLNEMLNVYLCGDNNGGKMADDIIEELAKRLDAEEAKK
jgi:hypothetical protein